MSTWRETYKVHPAADVFPMMSDEDLAKLGEDIKANGLKALITVDKNNILIDGRNRLEAMERAGVDLKSFQIHVYPGDNPVGWIVSLNIHRRHLTKQQQADLIVAAHKAVANKPRQVGEVSGLTNFGKSFVEGMDRLVDQLIDGAPQKGGRGKVDKVKAAAVATAKEHGIPKRTVERSFAKAVDADVKKHMRERVAKPMPFKAPSSYFPIAPGINSARAHYLRMCDCPGVDLNAEMKLIIDALREIAGHRMMQAQADDDLGDIPACLDRRRQP